MSNLLLKSIRQHKYDDLIEKHISQSETKASRELDQSSDYYLQKYFQAKNIHNIRSNYEKKLDKNLRSTTTYKDLSRNLDIFYIIEKLRIATDFLTWQKMYNSKDKIEQGLKLIKIGARRYAEVPSIIIYKLMHDINLKENSDDFYFELKEKAVTHIDKFPPDERREISDVLISYCVKKINQGNQEFQSEILALYDWAINKEIILTNGYLSPTSFRNYVAIGLREGKFDQVENFVKEKSELIEPKRKDNAVNFNLSRVAFYRKNYNEAIEYLNKVNYDEIWYNVNSKVLLFASYYELNELEVLLSSIDAFLVFLRRQKGVQDIRTARYSNFSSYLKRIINSKGNKAKVLRLKEKILNDSAIVNKQWLVEKVNQL